MSYSNFLEALLPDLCDESVLASINKTRTMNSSFTPGPWHVESYNNHVSVVANAQYTQQGTLVTVDHICDCNNGYAHPEEWVKYNEANARLIAAAPDLLSALQSIGASANRILLDEEWVKYNEAIDAICNISRLVDAVLAKATGLDSTLLPDTSK